MADDLCEAGSDRPVLGLRVKDILERRAALGGARDEAKRRQR